MKIDISKFILTFQTDELFLIKRPVEEGDSPFTADGSRLVTVERKSDAAQDKKE
jgi:hypothetical protein